jgi:hypothetical protein
MLKHTIISLVTAVFITSHSAAFNNKSLGARLEMPVFIVLDATDSIYNANVTYAIENYWSVNDYTFINESELDKCKQTYDNLFLIKNEKQQADDLGTIVYDDVMQIIYFRKEGKLMANVAGTPLIHENSDAKTAVINAVRVLQDKVQFALFKEEEKNKPAASYEKKVESRSSIVKAGKLYIAREDLDAAMSEADILALYDGALYIVSREELTRLIDSKDPEVLYAVVFSKKTSKVSYVNTKQVVSASTGEVVYLDQSTAIKPKGFTIRDIKILAE